MPARPRPRPRRSIAQRLRSLLWLALWGAVLWWGGGWLWQQPLMDRPRMLWQITRMDPPTALPVPVEGVAARRIADTWGAARDGGLGGRQVWVLGPARERHYYAHLDDWAPGLQTGDVVQPGTLLGFVGTTGNAQGTPPHLHYGIYGADGALNPWPLVRAGAQGAGSRRP